MSASLCRLLFGLFVGLAAGSIGFATEETPAVVVAIQVRGTVEVRQGANGAKEAVKEGRQLSASDVITTAKSSSVVLVLENGAVVSLRENSQLKITTVLQSASGAAVPAAKDAEPTESGTSKTSFELAFGEMLARVRKLNPSSTFEVQTPVSVAAVRGTVFEVAYHAEKSGPVQYRLSTASGLVHVTPRGGALVKVAGSDQMEFSARVRGQQVRIQPIKTTKLTPQKRAQLEKEAQETVRVAGDTTRRPPAPAAAATPAKPSAPATEKPKESAPPKAPAVEKTPAPDKPQTPNRSQAPAISPKENARDAAPAAARKKKAPDPS